MSISITGIKYLKRKDKIRAPAERSAIAEEQKPLFPEQPAIKKKKVNLRKAMSTRVVVSRPAYVRVEVFTDNGVVEMRHKNGIVNIVGTGSDIESALKSFKKNFKEKA